MEDKRFKQIYVESFDKICASKDLKDKINTMSAPEKKTSINVKLVSVLAACLVIVFLSVVIFGVGSNGTNSFVLKAGAAEIGSDSFVEISELYSNMSASGDLIVNAKEYPYYGRSCPLRVFCKGTNIKTVKYSVENGVFIFPLSSYATQYRDAYSDASELTDKIYGKVLADNKIEHGFENELQYSSFTMDYEDQLKLQDYDDAESIPILLSSQISLYDEELTDDALKIFEEDDEPDKYSMEDVLNDEQILNELLSEEQEICNQIFKRVRVTVEVTYDDGTIDSETFMLGCDSANEYKGFVITARIVNE